MKLPPVESTMLKSTLKHKSRIGEILLEYGLISHEQLTRALDRQVQTGKRLGSIFEELGYLDVETLLNILSSQYERPHVNLFEVNVPPEVLNLVPFDKVRSERIFPFRKSDSALSLAMVDPSDTEAIRSVEAMTGGEVLPYIAPHSQMDTIIGAFETRGYGDAAFDGCSLKTERSHAEAVLPGIQTLLKLMLDFHATDLHLAAGASPTMKIHDEFRRMSMPRVSAGQMKDYISDLLNKEQLHQFNHDRELECVLTLPDTGRFRLSIFQQRNSISLSARIVHESIPSFQSLGLPEWLSDSVSKTQGLMIIAGPAGQGKKATMAALVDLINSGRSCNIVTLENPIKYLHRHNKCNVNQREIGIDTESFSSGLKHILRQAPEVIAISDLRDPESITTALDAAESGHLVLGAIHATNAIDALDRIFQVFPEHQLHRIKMQLADTLLMVFSQKLIPLKKGEGKVIAYGKLTNSERVSHILNEGSTENLQALVQIGSTDLQPLEQRLARLCFDEIISFEEASAAVDNPTLFKELIKSGRI